MKTNSKSRVTQCQKPTGWLGRLVLRNMNARHFDVTNWGLSHISVKKHFTILDVGCGGGRTVSELAAEVTEGKVFGIDYSAASVAFASRTNREWIKSGRVEIRESSVSQLPFATHTFDLIVAVETHFWWPDLPGDLRELLRVLKPGGDLVIVAEIFKGASTMSASLVERILPSLKLLTPSEHRVLLTDAGYSQVRIIFDPSKGWIFAAGKKGEANGL